MRPLAHGRKKQPPMTGSITRWWVLGGALGVRMAAPACRQARFHMWRVAARVGVSQGELHGVIHDERGRPLEGAVIAASGIGASSMFAQSDRDGRYAFRSLRPGNYLLRAFLD